MTTTIDRPTPNKTLRGAWAKNIGEDFATQYTTAGGATVTLVRFTNPDGDDFGYFDCDGCGHANSDKPRNLPPYADVVPQAEAHVLACRETKPCHACGRR